MNQIADARLYYVHDPMCSWCWGFRPVWQQLTQQLPPGLQLVSWVGGLAPDSDVPMPQDLRNKLQATWQRIQQVIPGTEFNFDFWRDNTPRRSTYPACRAVIAARELADKEDEMTYGIQQAYYLQAKNPSDLDTLTEVAVAIGLQSDAFVELMTAPRIQQLLEQELQQVSAIGVNSFPSIVLETAGRRHDIKVDYNSATRLLASIQQLLAA
ncbi:MAG: DsbA family protein [Gammaproteobacteria bacterium]|nr:DsbA family protein [Gammaproteobacteria bacterium]